jgi:arylsulfatase A-like enzyme
MPNVLRVLFAAAAGWWLGGVAFAAAPVRPNILLIVADDLGWADVGWHGSRFKTPNLDRLVREGVELDQHYVQPLCTPTRTALMSGRYPGRFGPQALSPSNLRAMLPGTETIASALTSLGYETRLSGKWHLGSREEWCPNHYGFGHSYGSLAGAADPWTHKYRPGPYENTWHRDGRPVAEEGNATELVAAQAAQWIRETRPPWFIYVPFQAIHIPVDAPEQYKKMYEGVKFDEDPEKQDSLLRLGAFVSQMDAKVGEFVKALDEAGRRADTLIVFTSDNGGLEKGANPYVGTVKPSPANSSNLPLRGQKGQLYEGGIRVSAFANWPGVLAPRKVAAPMHAVDWFPTFAEVTGYRPARDLQWDGHSMWAALTGAQAQPAARTIYWAFTIGDAIRSGDWKLIEPHKAKGKGKGMAAPELFNLGADPFEKEDLAEKEPARVEELRALLSQARARDVTELPADLAGVPK